MQTTPDTSSRASEARSEPKASEGGGAGYARAVTARPASEARSEPKASEGGGAGYARAVTARPTSEARSEPKASEGGGAGYARAVTARLDRRAFLTGVGAGAGWLLARGLGVSRGPVSGETAAGFRELLRALAASLTPRQRELLVLPADHPSRQIANTIAVLERPHLGTLLSPAAARARASGSARACSRRGGATAFAGTVAVEGRLDGCVLAIYGEPESGRAQAVLMGGHVHAARRRREPERRGLRRRRRLRPPDREPALARRGELLRLPRRRREPPLRAPRPRRARPRRAPRRRPTSWCSRCRARAVASTGVARRLALARPARRRPARLLDTVFSCYPEAAQARAPSRASTRNGGLGALHVAYYASHGFYEDMRPWGEPRPRRARAARRSLLAGVAHRGAGHHRPLPGLPPRARLHPGGARSGARERRRGARRDRRGHRRRGAAPRCSRARCGARRARRWPSTPTRSRAASARARSRPASPTRSTRTRNHVVVATIEGRAMGAAAARAARGGGRRVRPGRGATAWRRRVLRGDPRDGSASPSASRRAARSCATRWSRTCARADSRTRRLSHSGLGRDGDHRREQRTASSAPARVKPAISATSKISKTRPAGPPARAGARGSSRGRSGSRACAAGTCEGEVVAADEQARHRVDRRHRRRARRALAGEQRPGRGAARESRARRAARACRRTPAGPRRRRRGRRRAARASQPGARPGAQCGQRQREQQGREREQRDAAREARAREIAEQPGDRRRHRVAARAGVAPGERGDGRHRRQQRGAPPRFVQRVGRSSARTSQASSAPPASAPSAKATQRRGPARPIARRSRRRRAGREREELELAQRAQGPGGEAQRAGERAARRPPRRRRARAAR